jgi:putative heme iron utilization protein
MSIADTIQQILTEQSACALATTSVSGHVDNSYCPYVYHNNALYIFISELAAHTQNLKHTKNCASLITSNATLNPFTRPRISLRHSAQVISRDTPNRHVVLAQLESKLGNTVALLRTLPDFQLVELKILQGTYIEGFGKAYAFEGDQFSNAELQTKGKA